MSYEDLELDEALLHEEQSVEILDMKDKVFKNKTIPW